MLFLESSPSLSTKDIHIYKFVATHIEEVVHMNIRELAEVVQVSTTTIVRFCRKFECEGFTEFKIRLQLYQGELVKNSHIAVRSEETFFNFAQHTKSVQFQQQVTKAAQLIKNKELILFISEKGLEAIADYGVFYFSNTSKIAVKQNLPLNNFDHLFSHMLEKIGVFVLSNDGNDQKINNELNRFIEKKVPIISVTNSKDSSLSDLSDITISHYTFDEHRDKSITVSQVPTLYIIEQIAIKTAAN
ncbi:MurR/RpiR family transcriptional regulator [Candidatus Enterococcus courvalinii]|uniref:MurR/RpiR family transcriptional regulator n=1 Tax=Candidatus Enterococcus courvalinii TaxID=2815329 RepID=A0ABS3HXN7_9ENTE|nr:MurR/RpiR family transcriptional regulator [Enterococcus sp. MSG2901]MBO0480825.1 MurR/RpiR family transcriptional regulator [Enterococcus sp. MSG2901]